MEKKQQSESEDAENLISKLNPIISIGENAFIEVEKGDGYILLTNEDRSKVVGICHRYIYLSSLTEMMKGVKEFTSNDRVIYLNIDFEAGIEEIKKEYKFDKLRVEKIPKELLSVYNRINVTLANTAVKGDEKQRV